MTSWRHRSFKLTIFATLQFLVLVHVAMWTYKGGTYHERDCPSYSYTYNFFSDLGRNYAFNGQPNFPTNLIFRTSMTIVGLCLVLYFIALPGVFKEETAQAAITLASFAGIISGVSYIGIAWVPYDWIYRGHHLLVRVGFVSFLLMSLLYAGAIFLENGYPKRYGYALILFSLILFSQILLMQLGDRSWQSNDALFRQATAQKVVVYAEIICMLYQTFGVLGRLKTRNSQTQIQH